MSVPYAFLSHLFDCDDTFGESLCAVECGGGGLGRIVMVREGHIYWFILSSFSEKDDCVQVVQIANRLKPITQQ